MSVTHFGFPPCPLTVYGEDSRAVITLNQLNIRDEGGGGKKEGREWVEKEEEEEREGGGGGERESTHDHSLSLCVLASIYGTRNTSHHPMSRRVSVNWC